MIVRHNVTFSVYTSRQTMLIPSVLRLLKLTYTVFNGAHSRTIYNITASNSGSVVAVLD